MCDNKVLAKPLHLLGVKFIAHLRLQGVIITNGCYIVNNKTHYLHPIAVFQARKEAIYGNLSSSGINRRI